MILPWRSIHRLQRGVHLWLFGYLLSSLPAAEWIWLHPAVPPLPAPPGPASLLTHALSTWAPPGSAIIAVFALMVLALRSVVLPSRWYITLVEWILFSNLVNFAWLASSGGNQLIVNVLFWMILLPGREEDARTATWPKAVWQGASFWIIRLQLLVAYAVTALDKLTGTHWLAGDAVGIVATDMNYGPAWLASIPLLAAMVNYAVLLFQLTFPVAVWWAPTRRWWFLVGVLFHLVTGITFGILDMGLAFLVVYPIWSRQGERIGTAPEVVRA
ncbi:MAG: HTTM domain-containing protein [Flavobacteriales bacterium]|nr:HTTM domain-containing protein [Flavobacteriales bacterium]